MTALLAAIRKESLLLLRDWHALALLFVMPTLFVMIMTLALQERYEMEGAIALPGQIIVNDQSPGATEFIRQLQTQSSLAFNASGQTLSHSGDLFALTITKDFSHALSGNSQAPGLYLEYAKELGARERSLILATISQVFARFNTTLIAEEMGYDEDYAREELLREGFIATQAKDSKAITPTAVQQNVPAWLIFAMFFVAIPLSTTVINDRQQRTLIRAQTFGINAATVFGAILIPYFVINLAQLGLMLSIGHWVLPMFGAAGLSLDVALAPLLAIAVCTSLSALALASAIASCVRTTEQATVTSAAINLLLAAIGGVMIPVFIMPPIMQHIAAWTPMAWALEGFLAVLVRGGSWAEIALPCAHLLGATTVLTAFALFTLKRGNEDA